MTLRMFVFLSKDNWLLLRFLIFFKILFLERGREGEKHRSVASGTPPAGDLALTGTELVTFRSTGQSSVPGATPAGAAAFEMQTGSR